MKTIAEQWALFEQMVLPQKASPLQRQDMRRAFYSGFQAAMVAGIEIAAASGDDDARGAAMLQALHDECAQFVVEVHHGRA